MTASVEVEGASVCPTPAQVQLLLTKLLPAESTGSPHVARVGRVGQVLQVELRDRSGAVLARRELQDGSSCSDLASVAAVVIAAWETDLGERLLALPPPLPRPEPQPPPAPSQLEVGIGGLVSFAGAFAPGAEAHASYAPGESKLGAELVLVAEGARSLEVGSGRARWYRLGAGLGPRLRAFGPWPRVDLHAQALAGLLTLRGSGFEENAPPVTDFELGALAGARASIPFGASRPWLGLALALWPAKREVRVGTVGDPNAEVRASENLPRFELLLTVGASFGAP